ncbi:hypothetical protein P692DRAFT_20924519 [Suillus brevipes Sb2]|nr:hypothetical protein P692DRAFT_20924519 [Suillus brevipes Sb2]
MTWYELDRKLTSVLIDYDVSSLAEPGPRGNERTDTVPFLALDMLTAEGQRGEVKHLYRHDLESFIWCFAWISLRYKNGVLLPRGSRPFDEWAQLEARKCFTEKNYFLAYPQTPKHSHIYPLLWSLILDCLDLLETDYFYRRKRQYLLSKERGETPTDTEETESDIDSLLQRFKDTKSWVALSKPSREPSL